MMTLCHTCVCYSVTTTTANNDHDKVTKRLPIPPLNLKPGSGTFTYVSGTGKQV